MECGEFPCGIIVKYRMEKRVFPTDNMGNIPPSRVGCGVAGSDTLTNNGPWSSVVNGGILVIIRGILLPLIDLPRSERRGTGG